MGEDRLFLFHVRIITLLPYPYKRIDYNHSWYATGQVQSIILCMNFSRLLMQLIKL